MEKEIVLWLVFCYLLGSVLPAYIFGKLLKGIDIRKKGTKNAGTINAFRVLGFWPGAITGIFDFTKGVVAIVGAVLLGFPEIFVYLSGVMIIAGHRYPFYLNFRGGVGLGSVFGIILASICFYQQLIYEMWFVLFLVVAYLIDKFYREKSIKSSPTIPAKRGIVRLSFT